MLQISKINAIFALTLKKPKKELFSLFPVKSKPIEVSFTAPDLSSQGGLLLMNEYGQHHGFIAKLSDCVEDTRSKLLVQHPYYEMFRQRICQIAAGYKDVDDSDLLRHDSILKLCSGRFLRVKIICFDD